MCDFRKNILLVLALLSLCFVSESKARERAGRRSQDQKSQEVQELVTKAAKDISDKLTPVLEHINEEDSVGPGDISILNDVLRVNTRYVAKMEAVDKSNFFILSAWTKYFSSDMEPALKDSIKAFKASPEMPDAEATLLTMALVNKNYAALKPIKTYKKRLAKKQKRKTDNSTYRNRARLNRNSSSQGILNLDTTTVNYDLIGRVFGQGKLKCLNGEVLEIGSKNKLYCFLIWKSDYTVKNTEKSKRQKSRIFGDIKEDEPAELNSNDAKVKRAEEFETFGQFCLGYSENKNVAFVSVNTDDKTDREKILKYIAVNSGPWAQAILDGQGGSYAKLLYKVNIGKPAFMIVKDNKILYTGGISNYLSRILIEKQLGSAVSETEQQQETVDVNSVADKTVSEAEAAIELKKDTKNTVDEKVLEQLAPSDKKKDNEEVKNETDTLIDSIEAAKLYELAKIHFKKGRYIGYKKCVDACREILEKYPNTKQMVLAREMLRQLPADVRRRYKITDKELGFKKD